MVEIDGSYLEGGGAILRVASALSAITGKPLKVYNIRAGRKNPGLRAQHLEGLKAIADLCNGGLVNAALGSTEIELHPGRITSKQISVQISTAGSVGLLFQSLKAPIAMSDGEVTIRIQGGATFAKWAPPLLTTNNVLLPMLARIGYSADLTIERHGFYPKGGARVMIRGKPSSDIKPLCLTEPGELLAVKGVSVASSHLQKARVADRQAEAARRILSGGGINADMDVQYVDAVCPGSGVVLWAETSAGTVLGADSLGERGTPAEKVGEEAAKELLETLESGATVDDHVSDQLLIFMALAKGESSIVARKLTDHAKTNIYVIQRFLPVVFRVTEDKNVLIKCVGAHGVRPYDESFRTE
jgi:RNA 3'-terminal phosphate cyclase (ATP)/RNA 3'-terminal phosphate cyclase (GTP)